MATILELALTSAVLKWDPALPLHTQEFRSIYGSPRLKTWIEGDLPGLESTWNVELTPAEQLTALVEIYCSGDVLTFGWQFKPLTHVKDGIWELKTADLRVFGWFHKRDCFVGACADTKDRIKLHKLYHGYAGEVARFRDRLDLDEPKFVPGDDPNAVVSNYSFP